MLAIISDLHSNLEALTAVFADSAAFPVQRTVCLGDVIGYGPNPRETLELMDRCDFVLLGNHEQGLQDGALKFNPRARKALDWTRCELNSKAFSREANYALWDRIERMLHSRQEGEQLFVHASPRSPIEEYILPKDSLNMTEMAAVFRSFDGRVAFGGHTHVPGVIREGFTFAHQSEFDGWFTLPLEKTLVNVGSVGQPRDGQNTACYVLLDGDRMQFRRVAYDYQTTMKKIRAVAELDDFLAKRLQVGQ
ncbi:MAG: metallophosphoesterase [Planctomycetes bacterium]|nr:metallophosphoesterase [Planctomycetota bacterium]